MTKMIMTVVTALTMKVKTVLMMATVKVQICCSKRKMEQNTQEDQEVPRVIRYVKYNKKDPENYLSEQLMFFVPWGNEQKYLLGSFDTFDAHYKSVQTSLIPKRNEYAHRVEELELARQIITRTPPYP